MTGADHADDHLDRRDRRARRRGCCNASKAFVHRRSLASWADGAAIVAAQYAAEDAIYAGPAVDELPISASRTRDAVADYVSRNGLRQRFEGFDVAVTVDPSTATVTVEFAARVPLILARAGGAGGVP